jgi:hypothetical protein
VFFNAYDIFGVEENLVGVADLVAIFLIIWKKTSEEWDLEKSCKTSIYVITVISAETSIILGYAPRNWVTGS